MPVAQDYMNGVRSGLSGVNGAALLGATDTLWSANATVTLVIAAVDALAQVAGGSPDLAKKVGRALRRGQLSGALPETHSVTTKAGAQALFTAIDPSLPAAYVADLGD